MSFKEISSDVPSFCQPYKPASHRPRLLFTADNPNAGHEPHVLPTEHLKIIGENLKAQDEVKDEETKPPPDPQETIARLLTARGELDVAIDLIGNLESSKYLDYKITSVKSGASAMHTAAIDGLGDLGRHRKQMKACAQRLKEGAQALRLLAEKDNRYLAEIGSLQRYWKLRANPTLPEFADAPFSVDLDLWSEASSSSTSSLPASGSAPLCSIKTLFPIQKDAGTGRARLEIDHEDGELLVAEGGESINELLRVEQVNIFWRTSLNWVEQEIRELPAEKRCQASDLFNRLFLSSRGGQGLSSHAVLARSLLLDIFLRRKESTISILDYLLSAEPQPLT